ncbi:MAG: ABC transporter ATP-binding protein [Candidatus Heimdallarchaeota archaeon]|nr:ABC transporter ATP-binding protein [Candidatus Heimdallarchaeota archaeon]
MKMVKISIENLKVEFGDFTALHGLSVEIPEGKITTLLGPSGCGKTTTLRSIAGFNESHEKGGIIKFDDKDISQLPPQKRDTGFVFQNYALWPHMSVFDNIAYGLVLREVEKEEIKEKVTRVARMVNIEDQLEKKPADLSGGQQQRVALARALVIEPSVLLCDEPLSNLDAKLRLDMRLEIRRIANELNLTVVWVTHDQAEALSLSDQIVVIEKGEIIQIGDPTTIYTNPSTQFVAEFMGEGTVITANVMKGNPLKVKTSFDLELNLGLATELKMGSEVKLVIRPESIHYEIEDGDVVFDGEYIASLYLGHVTRLQLRMSDGTIIHFDRPGKPLTEEQLKVGKAGIKSSDILVFQDGKRIK